MDVDSIFKYLDCCASQELKPPFQYLSTIPYSRRITRHTAILNVLKAFDLKIDYFEDMNKIVSMIIGDFSHNHLYRKYNFSRSDGTIKELKVQLLNGTDSAFVLKFLSRYFGVSIVTISQFNETSFYPAIKGKEKYFDVIVMKEVRPQKYALCHNSLFQKRVYQYKVLSEILSMSNVCMSSVNEKDLQKLSWEKIKELASQCGIESMVPKKSGTGLKKRYKKDIINDLLFHGMENIPV